MAKALQINGKAAMLGGQAQTVGCSECCDGDSPCLHVWVATDCNNPLCQAIICEDRLPTGMVPEAGLVFISSQSQCFRLGGRFLLAELPPWAEYIARVVADEWAECGDTRCSNICVPPDLCGHVNVNPDPCGAAANVQAFMAITNAVLRGNMRDRDLNGNIIRENEFSLEATLRRRGQGVYEILGGRYSGSRVHRDSSGSITFSGSSQGTVVPGSGLSIMAEVCPGGALGIVGFMNALPGCMAMGANIIPACDSEGRLRNATDSIAIPSPCLNGDFGSGGTTDLNTSVCGPWGNGHSTRTMVIPANAATGLFESYCEYSQSVLVRWCNNEPGFDLQTGGPQQTTPQWVLDLQANDPMHTCKGCG